MKPAQESKTIYYLPGANGRIETGLGEGLRSRGFEVFGRATVGEFRQLRFQEQIDLIAKDLTERLWATDARVVANSYGAYLFLHAQSQLPPYVGRVLLLSPILGTFEDEDCGRSFSPPRADRLMRMARGGKFPAPLNGEIHVGDQDWQSPPHAVQEFGQLTNLPVHIVPKRGHMLGKDYVGSVLDRWTSRLISDWSSDWPSRG